MKKSSAEQVVEPNQPQLKKVKLSSAETQTFQGLNQQKEQIQQQMLALTQSIIESRDHDVKAILGGVNLNDNYTELSFTTTES